MSFSRTSGFDTKIAKGGDVPESGRTTGGKTSPSVSASPVKILLVDDEARNLDVLESLLNTPEHSLVRAPTPDQALMHLLTGDFAVIVLDIQMPNMSGIELAKLIKQRRRTRHIPIIFLTAYYQEDEDVLEGYGSGAVDYLTKPINPQILRSKIAVFVDLFRKSQALEASNTALETEIEQRLNAEEALRKANNELEARVNARTADLSRANEELRTREAALRESETMLKAASYAKDDFLAALSHELRTPLNPVLLLASHLAGEPTVPDGMRAHFETIRKNVELEARLIDDLLDLTRITRGVLRLELRPVDAHTAVGDAFSIVKPEADEKRLRFHINFGASEHMVFGDIVRLQQVFWNLLKNAVKFTPTGGEVTIESSTEIAQGELTIRVADTGIGLTADELERIFEAFVQGDHAHRQGSHRFGGLGLGLAISRTLVEMHEGRIEASSGGRGMGSAFVVTLPLLRSMPEATGSKDLTRPEGAFLKMQHARTQAQPVGRRVRILVVDDHAATRATLSHLLESHEYDVAVAGSAAEARAYIAREQFDLVISDIGLPDGGGCELLGELREVQPNILGIAMSGYGMEEDVERSRNAGFVEHIVKPVTFDALNEAIQMGLEKESERKHF
jgi:signal transduction histidine kinase